MRKVQCAEEAVFRLRKEVQVIVDSVRLERYEGLLGFHDVGAQKIGVEVKDMFKGEGFTECPIESYCIWVAADGGCGSIACLLGT